MTRCPEGDCLDEDNRERDASVHSVRVCQGEKQFFFLPRVPKKNGCDDPMAAESQTMRTVCLHTSDAKERNQGRFLFRMPNETSHAIKVALGSFEFPMTQWTVESTWSLLYVNEGIHITPELQNLRIEVRDIGERHRRTTSSRCTCPCA